MLIQDLDLGGSHPFAGPDSGATVAPIVVEGSHTITYGRAGKATAHNVKLWVKAWQAVGGQAAGTIPALRYVLRQAQELAANRNMGPVYIRWTSSADPAAVLNAADLYDGWYWITSFNPDYTKVPSGLVPVQMQVVEVAQGGNERSVATSYFPASPGLSTAYSGTAQLAVGYPLNSAYQTSSLVNRAGAEGNVSLSIAPPSNLNPLPFGLSATVGDWFKGGVRLYDTVNTGSNPVPTNGAFVNANWVQVYDRSHRFGGDLVLTNGLALVLVAAGGNISLYLWSTGLSTPAWQQWATLVYQDNAANNGTWTSYALDRVGLEESSLYATSRTIAGNNATIRLRLQRGSHAVRADFSPKTQANTNANGFLLSFAGVVAKIAYTSGSAADVGTTANLATVADYGYAATFQNSASFPFIVGWLKQGAAAPPFQAQAATSYMSFGDNDGPAQNATRSYAFFAIPYGVNATYSTANLQAEGESGALGTGWSSVADGAASAGNTAKAASGTGSGNADLFGTSFVPAAGIYDVWFRVKVTSAAGSASEMQLGLWDTTAGSFVASTTYKANQSGTSYGWLQACIGVTPTASHNMQFRAVTAATLGTDWFIDEAVLVPKSLTTAYTGPQDLWQQFMADRTTRLVRL